MKLALFLMRFMQILLLPLFVFLKVLTGKWESTPAGRGPVPTQRLRGRGLHGNSCPWKAPGEQAPLVFPLGSSPSPISPWVHPYSSGVVLSGGSPAVSGAETVRGGGAGSLGECGSPLSNQRPSRHSVSRTTVGDSVPLTRV